MEYKKCPCCEINYIIRGKELICKSCLKSPQGKDFIIKHLPPEEIERLKKLKEEKERQRAEAQRQQKRIAREVLLRHLESFGFEGFLHTADFKNFIKIFKSGKLMSRVELTNKKIKFIDNAEPGVIENTPQIYKMYTRFYYRPKTPTNYAAYKYHNQKNPVLMVFSKELINYEDTFFTNGCAAASRTIKTRDAEFALNFNWKEVFRDDPFTPEEITKNAFGVGPKNFRNAEFLYGKSVETKKIKKVYFKNLEDYRSAIRIFGRDSRFEYNSDKFYGG